MYVYRYIVLQIYSFIMKIIIKIRFYYDIDFKMIIKVFLNIYNIEYIKIFNGKIIWDLKQIIDNVKIDKYVLGMSKNKFIFKVYWGQGKILYLEDKIKVMNSMSEISYFNYILRL